jgi:Protein of unknown function (DUF2974)
MPTVWTVARLADDVYLDTPNGLGPWSRHNKMPPMKSWDRFFGAVYFNAKMTAAVIAFRGSAEAADWTDADVDIARKRMPIDQLSDAFAWTSKVMPFAKGLGCKNIFITGHSLGGGLAQVVAANMPGVMGVTFNAPGMKGMAGPVKMNDKYDRILNVRLDWDPVSAVGVHLGKKLITLKNGSVSPLNHKMPVLIRAIESSWLGTESVENLI